MRALSSRVKGSVWHSDMLSSSYQSSSAETYVSWTERVYHRRRSIVMSSLELCVQTRQPGLGVYRDTAIVIPDPTQLPGF